MHGSNRMAADRSDSARAEALIEAHSIARSGVTLGGPVIGPGEVLHIRSGRLPPGSHEKL
jgi:hypothetical protein